MLNFYIPKSHLLPLNKWGKVKLILSFPRDSLFNRKTPKAEGRVFDASRTCSGHLESPFITISLAKNTPLNAF